MQVEMIKWLAYPENKPTNPVDICDIRTYQIWYQGELYDAEWVQDNRVWGFIRDCDDELLYDGDITFWCEYMNDPDPEAKQFNFWTALEMMKDNEAIILKDLTYNEKHRFENGMFMTYVKIDSEDNGQCLWMPAVITKELINGLWEVANAD